VVRQTGLPWSELRHLTEIGDIESISVYRDIVRYEPCVVEIIRREFASLIPDGLLYWIGPAGEFPLKVGWTRDLARRLPSLNTGSWQPLHVYATLPAFQAEERVAHAQLKPYRVRGEWYERGPAFDVLTDLALAREADLEHAEMQP
jgi:hypothetical protein